MSWNTVRGKIRSPLMKLQSGCQHGTSIQKSGADRRGREPALGFPVQWMSRQRKLASTTEAGFHPPSDCQYVSSRPSLRSSTPLPGFALVTDQTASLPSSLNPFLPTRSSSRGSGRLLSAASWADEPSLPSPDKFRRSSKSSQSLTTAGRHGIRAKPCEFT